MSRKPIKFDEDGLPIPIKEQQPVSFDSDGLPIPIKKKVGTVSFGETYSSPELDSETPSTGKIPEVVDIGGGNLMPANPILLSKKYNELNNATKEVSYPSSGKGGQLLTTVPDEDSRKVAKQIKEYLGDINPEQLNSEMKGLSDEDINIHGEELLADRKQNPQLYQRKLGRLKWERGLNEELLKSVDSGRLNNDDYNNISASIKSSLENSSVGDYKQQRENVNSVANAIKQFGGENKEQLLKEYATEVSKVYGNSYNFGFEKSKQDSPESKYLITPEAQLGYDYIKDLSPEKAEQYKRLFVDVKSLNDKPEEQKGYNHLMQTLEETGIGLMENSVNEELNSLKTIAEKTGGLTPEQIDKATKLEEKLSELNQKKTELDSKYPDRINDKVDDAIQEILGQNLSWGSYAAGSAGKAFKNTAQGIWEAVSTPFMSDESNRLRELYIMGQSLDENQVYRKTDANKALVTDTLVIKPELQSQIDAIKNDKTLSREQKELKLYPLLKNNSDKFGRVPIQGGKFNVNPSSILYGVTDLGTTLLPFIALEAATGGIGGAGAAAKFLRTFTAAAATSFHDEYANAILEGKSESDAYKEAMGLTAINSFAMAGAGTVEAVRSMAGLKTSAGQIISRMSDAEIKKVLERGTKSKALNALKDRISATPEMIKKGAESGAKFEVAMNAAQEAKGQLYNTEIDREEQFKHNLLNIANFSLLGGVLGHVGYKSPSNLQKSGLIEFGKNPDGFLASIEQMKKEGALSQADFDQRKGLIEKSAEAYKSLPQLNDKGKPLSTKEQGEILYNTVIKNEGKKAASTLPPQQAEKAEMKSMVADYANGIILENPTDKQLESRKSTLEKQIEGKDENGKPLLPEKELLKAKAQLEAVNDAIQRKENGVEVQAPINTGESIPLKTEEPPVVPPIPPVVGSEGGAFVEPPEISFRKDSFVRARNKVGIDEFVDESKTTHIKEATKAQRTIEQWKEDGSYAENIADIQERATNGQISNQEKFIFAKHLADLDATVNSIKDVNSKEYDIALGEYNRALNAADAARSEAGRQLGMIPKNRGVAQTLADVMSDMMNDNNTGKLTTEQKKTAEKRYEKIKEALDKEAALRIEAEAKAEELRAENSLLKKQAESKGKPKEGKVYKDGKRDFDAETKNYKDELKKLADEYKAAGQKLGLSSDGGAESFVISAKMAKVVMKIVGVKVEQMGVKLKEVTEATLKEVKDIFDGITEKDIREIIAGKYNEKKATKNDLLSQMHDLKQEQKLLFELEALENGETPKTEKALKAKNQRLKELRDKIDALKKQNGIGKYSDESKVAAAEKAAQKNIEELEDKIANNDLEFDKIEKPTSPQLDAYREKQKALRKELEEKRKEAKVGKYSDESKFISAAKSRIEANKKKQQEISDKIKNKDFSEEPESKSILDNTELQKKNKKLYEEYQKSVIDKEKALFQYEQERIDDKIRNYNLAEKVGHWAELAFHTSKGSVAIFDQSGLLVQLIQTTLSHPWQSVKNIPPALRDLVTPKWFDANMAKLKQSKYWDLFQKMELPLYDTHSHDINFRNELLGGDKNLMNKDIVINGKKMSIGKAFERSTATLFNNIRVKLAIDKIDQLHREGKTWENSPEEFKSVAMVISEFTGHGKVHKAFSNENWNILIWSSKMMASTFNVLGLGDLVRPVSTAKAVGKGLEKTKVGNLLGIKNVSIDQKKSKGFYSSLTPKQRVFAVKEMSRFIASGAVLLAAAYLKGQLLDDKDEKTTVDVNPLSTDFGTIKTGNKTVNVYGRFSSAVAALSQIIMGVRYLGGREDVLGDKYGDKSKADIAFGKFGRGKMTPLVGLGYDYFFNNKKNYFTKEDITATGALKQAISPLAFQDVAKDIKRNDPALSVVLWTLFKVYGGNVRDRRDYISQDLKMPEWKFLNEKGLKLSDKSKESLNPIDKEGKPIEVTEDKYKEFLKKREEYVKGNIKRLMDGKEYFKDKNNKYKSITKSDLNKVTYDEIKSWLMTKTNQANDKAMLDVFNGKQRENTPDRKIETSDKKIKKIRK